LINNHIHIIDKNKDGDVVMSSDNTPKTKCIITKDMEKNIMIALVKSVLAKGLISDEIYYKMVVKINQS
jgi:hypothetical protein